MEAARRALRRRSRCSTPGSTSPRCSCRWSTRIVVNAKGSWLVDLAHAFGLSAAWLDASTGTGCEPHLRQPVERRRDLLDLRWSSPARRLEDLVSSMLPFGQRCGSTGPGSSTPTRGRIWRSSRPGWQQGWLSRPRPGTGWGSPGAGSRTTDPKPIPPALAANAVTDDGTRPDDPRGGHQRWTTPSLGCWSRAELRADPTRAPSWASRARLVPYDVSALIGGTVRGADLGVQCFEKSIGEAAGRPAADGRTTTTEVADRARPSSGTTATTGCTAQWVMADTEQAREVHSSVQAGHCPRAVVSGSCRCGTRTGRCGDPPAAVDQVTRRQARLVEVSVVPIGT